MYMLPLIFCCRDVARVDEDFEKTGQNPIGFDRSILTIFKSSVDDDVLIFLASGPIFLRY